MFTLCSKKTFLTIAGVASFLLTNTITSHAAGTKTEQIKEMTQKIQNSVFPEKWPIRFSVITDTTGPLKVWLGGQDYRLNATKGTQHYLTYQQTIPNDAPIFEIKTLIGETRVVCKTTAGEQLDGKKLSGLNKNYLEAVRITISRGQCRLKPAYRKLNKKDPRTEDTESVKAISDSMGNIGSASQNIK